MTVRRVRLRDGLGFCRRFFDAFRHDLIRVRIVIEFRARHVVEFDGRCGRGGGLRSHIPRRIFDGRFRLAFGDRLFVMFGYGGLFVRHGRGCSAHVPRSTVIGNGFVVMLGDGFVVMLGNGFVLMFRNGFVVMFGNGFVVMLRNGRGGLIPRGGGSGFGCGFGFGFVLDAGRGCGLFV